MAYALATAKVDERGRDDIKIFTGGTEPAEAVHAVVIEVMSERGFDLSGHAPQAVSMEELHSADIVITMGCSTEDVCPATWTGDARDWGLPDPHGKSLAEVREIRDRIDRNVNALFDEFDHD